MTREDAAAVLNGSEYGNEGSRETFAQMKGAGLVAVFGASDDLIEFRGALYDEIGAYDGTSLRIDGEGIVPTFDAVSDTGDEDQVGDYFRRKHGAASIDALWAAEAGYSWTFRTSIPHATFEVVEDGEPYCRGIVFALVDAAAVA